MLDASRQVPGGLAATLFGIAVLVRWAQVMPLASDSDAQVAERVQRQSADAGPAEAELCRRFGPRLRAYGRRHLRDADKANDLSQRVLMLVIEKLRASEVRDVASIAGFVLGTAQHVAQAMKRGEARHEPLSESAEPWHDPAPRLALDSARISTCLGELEDRERAVIVLSYFEELTAPDTAAALGLSAGNVRVMRHRALSALRECFERSGRAA